MGCELKKGLRLYFFLRILLILGLTPIAAAMPVKSETLKKNVKVVDAENRPLLALDLKSKSMTLGAKELELCGSSMVRVGQTLAYSCTVPIPLKAKVSRLQNLTSKTDFSAIYAGTSRRVRVQVSDDAKTLILATSFDATGIDFDMSKFNDDFFAVYAQAAHSVISEALKKQIIKMEVLESRN